MHEKGKLDLVLEEASEFSFCSSGDTVSSSHLLSPAPPQGRYPRKQSLAEVDTVSNSLNLPGQCAE